MSKITSFISQNYKHPIAIVIYIIIIAIIIYYVGKSRGAFSNKPNELPKDKGWGKDLTSDQSNFVRQTVARLFGDMDSYLVSVGLRPRDSQVYTDFSGMDDRLFTATYNDFNDLYLKEEKGTLKEWIDDEAGLDGSVKKIIMQKFARLNLM